MLWFQMEELLKIIMMSSLPCFQIEELLKIIMMSLLPWFQIEELFKMMSSLPWFQIEELLKIIMMSSLPWFQIEELPKTKGFHHCQIDAGDTCPSDRCHQHGRWIIKGPHMTRSHLLHLSWAVNHYAMSRYQVAPHDWSLLSLSLCACERVYVCACVYEPEHNLLLPVCVFHCFSLTPSSYPPCLSVSLSIPHFPPSPTSHLSPSTPPPLPYLSPSPTSHPSSTSSPPNPHPSPTSHPPPSPSPHSY